WLFRRGRPDPIRASVHRQEAAALSKSYDVDRQNEKEALAEFKPGGAHGYAHDVALRLLFYQSSPISHLLLIQDGSPGGQVIDMDRPKAV
ncbi:MAG: hypothetical protein WBW33_17320, partial [Bryobacteraceae bacterium]